MYPRYIKRFLDIGFSIFLIAFLSPLMALVAFAILIDLKTNFLFKQLRVGYKENVFEIIKFRSMNNKTDDEGVLLPDKMRITPLGKLLRKTSIDELPQIYNVLKGSMSFVGPRPLIPKYLPYYTKTERVRHNIRPGITGLAQIGGRNVLSWNDRFRLDIEYVNNVSFFMDLRIVISTLVKVLKSEGVVVNTNMTLQDLDIERRKLNNSVILSNEENNVTQLS